MQIIRELETVFTKPKVSCSCFATGRLRRPVTQIQTHNLRFFVRCETALPPAFTRRHCLGIIAPPARRLIPKKECGSCLRRVGKNSATGSSSRPTSASVTAISPARDRERASDLMRMFTDKSVDAILCVRGGYGTARLLPLLDYQTIRANPKSLSATATSPRSTARFS